MIPSQKCYENIKRFEALRLNAYQDIKGVWTIGYGTVNKPGGGVVKPGDTCTKEEATQMLTDTVKSFAAGVEKRIKVPINQNQFDALVSFSYNVGLGAFISSTLLSRINVNPNTPNIRDAFMMWNKIRKDGKMVELEGLTKRRKLEADWYFSN